MKRVLFISIFAALSIICSAQEAYTLSSVIQAEGKSSEQIYSAVKSWSLKALRSVKDAQQMDDPEAKILSYRISADYSYGSFSMIAYDGWYSYQLIVQCRDGRFKAEITNVIHENKPGNAKNCSLGLVLSDSNAYKSYNKKVVEDIQNKLSTSFDNLCKEIENIVNSAGQSAEDDW